MASMAREISKTRRMWWPTFVREFKPMTNHLDDNAAGDGFMFETYGEELDFVRKQNRSHIWTLVEGDNGRLYVVEGYHLVNRLGYFVAKVPALGGLQIDVVF